MNAIFQIPRQINVFLISCNKVLLKIFDAEFPYKLSYFEPFCLLNKMAAKTVKRPTTL